MQGGMASLLYTQETGPEGLGDPRGHSWLVVERDCKPPPGPKLIMFICSLAIHHPPVLLSTHPVCVMYALCVRPHGRCWEVPVNEADTVLGSVALMVLLKVRQFSKHQTWTEVGVPTGDSVAPWRHVLGLPT